MGANTVRLPSLHLALFLPSDSDFSPPPQIRIHTCGVSVGPNNPYNLEPSNGNFQASLVRLFPPLSEELVTDLRLRIVGHSRLRHLRSEGVRSPRHPSSDRQLVRLFSLPCLSLPLLATLPSPRPLFASLPSCLRSPLTPLPIQQLLSRRKILFPQLRRRVHREQRHSVLHQPKRDQRLWGASLLPSFIGRLIELTFAILSFSPSPSVLLCILSFPLQTYIATILTHVNAYNGVSYANDPTILAWETGNELGGCVLSLFSSSTSTDFLFAAT